MTTAEEILARTIAPENEPHIVVGYDRSVTVPQELRMIAVQFDHNVETVTFDCPRYWDGHDISKMEIFINYMRSDNKPGQFHCTDVTIDNSDENLMHFTWTITGHVTEVVGTISFLVCAKMADENGDLTNRWNSLLNQDMTIAKGLVGSGDIETMYPDGIMAILLRLDSLVYGTSGQGAPTETTTGAVGSLYMDLDTNRMYKCISVNDGVYTWASVDGVGITGAEIERTGYVDDVGVATGIVKITIEEVV